MDMSFDYPTGYGYATEHILDPCGFEVEIDHKTDTIDVSSIKGFGDLFDEVEAHKNTPQQFIKWLAVSKRWINAGDRDGNTNKEIIKEITEMIENSLLERTA
jgi:hypothetical protein